MQNILCPVPGTRSLHVQHSGHLLCHQARTNPGQTGIFRGRSHSPGEQAEAVIEESELSLALRCVSCAILTTSGSWFVHLLGGGEAVDVLENRPQADPQL